MAGKPIGTTYKSMHCLERPTVHVYQRHCEAFTFIDGHQIVLQGTAKQWRTLTCPCKGARRQDNADAAAMATQKQR